MRFPHLLIVLCSCFATTAHAAEPAIRNVNIRGLQIGGTTTLVIDGDDLGKNPGLLFSFPAKTALKPGGTDKQATFDLTLPDDVSPGYHHLRVVTDGGVSLPLVLGVDRLPQRVFGSAVDALPIALHGAVNGSGAMETKFTGKAGQKLLIEVEAQRLGSKLRPVLHLVGPKKLQIGWAWATPALFGDARLETVLPEDGSYAVGVHDAEYAAPAPSFFRLKIGQWAYVDQVFPPVVSKGHPQSIELLGQSPVARVELAGQPDGAFAAIPLPNQVVWSGPRPFATLSPHPELLEKSDASKAFQDLPPGPVGVSGRLVNPYDEHRYRVPVTQGTKVRFEVFAERYGSPLDVELVVRNEKGDVLARANDAPGTVDPVLEYVVPDKMTAVIVGVLDGQGRASPRGVYRLTVEPQPAALSNADFRLTTTAQRVSLPAGGRFIVPVSVERRGYAGKVDLGASGLPAGTRLDGMTVPEGADGALVTLERSDPFGPAVISAWSGRGSDGQTQPLTIKGHPLEKLQPWLATELAVASTNFKAADFQVDWNNLPSDTGIVPGMKLAFPVKATRANPKTNVKLTLLTSQNPPLVNNQPDPNKTIRQEKPVELEEKGQTGEVTALVPVELPSPVYDVAVQAELLGADKKPLAVAYTPVRRMAVRLPLAVALEGSNRLEAVLDAKKGATISIKGKIERREGLKGDVAVNLTGLPSGAKADAVNVKGDAALFTVNIVLPPTIAAGEIKNLKLTASAAPDPKQPAQRVKSRDAELTLVVKGTPK